MLTRRHFIAAAGAAAASRFARLPELRAAQYDLLIKGGRVIDPARRFDRVADVAIAGGKIAAVRPNVPAASAADTIDASGKLVVPGLIDIHTHAGREKEDGGLCLADGVTSLVDAGSAGADGIDQVVANAKAAPNRMRVFVNIGRKGIIPEGDLMDLANVDAAAARAAIERHRDVVVGIKARLSNNVAGKNDVEALRRAQSVARPLGVPIMIHMGQTASPLPDILAILKAGDIVTHMYAPPPNAIFDDSGKLLPAVVDARKRGVWFDFGNGRLSHFTWATLQHGLDARVVPDTISTDWGQAARTDQVFNFANVLSKFLMLGMPLDRVIACATVNAAKTLPAFTGLGTLAVGAPADVAILELREGSFEFEDNDKAKRQGRQKLVTTASIFGGRRA
ncbi:MAG TPA: amidohydrolase/deacetylase family metallohydrolase [Vicinamibacterales bacterium]|nr:amidohydrolase/deacetylase family metallohydrolase [Vicinamibacterales bacterium]